MKILGTLFSIILFGCSDTAESINQDIECYFDFSNPGPCNYGDYQVNISTHSLASDEIQLQKLQVKYRDRHQALKITPDTSLLEGDKGLISFEDINFDGIADVSISTSFGLANQYMDYWIFDTQQDQFVKIGNHVRFNLEPARKTLTNTVKINAADYQKNEYTWQGSHLIKK